MSTTSPTVTRRPIRQENWALRRIAGIIIGIVETALAFRLVFKLLGANASNGFVHGLYAGTEYYVGIFKGIFSTYDPGGAAAGAVFEPATLIAMAVAALVGWMLLRILRPSQVGRSERTGSDSDGQEN